MADPLTLIEARETAREDLGERERLLNVVRSGGFWEAVVQTKPPVMIMGELRGRKVERRTIGPVYVA